MLSAGGSLCHWSCIGLLSWNRRRSSDGSGERQRCLVLFPVSASHSATLSVWGGGVEGGESIAGDEGTGFAVPGGWGWGVADGEK